MKAHPDIQAVNARLGERMADLVRTLLGESTSRSRGELRFRRKGSLSVVVSGAKRGSWHDHEAGCGGDPLGLIAHVHRVSMRDAYMWTLEWLGERQCVGSSSSITRRPAPTRELYNPCEGPAACNSWSVDKARELWREAVDPAGTVVEAYLATRGLSLRAGAPVRFHPRAWRNSTFGPHGPAQIALMTDAGTGEPCGAHVTYLRPDGGGKADGERSKVMLGAAGVIRLVSDCRIARGLGLAEGIETALAVMQRAAWAPVWAASSAGAISSFPVLQGIGSLTVFADADEAGMKAARECCRRWSAAGRRARLLAPPAGDWDDALPEQKEAA
ncbi:DUF7146 domain-containing protein [Roseomonas harenae]|uniref:DUF7146 domain-containing protein n=1 Tax=Muricoccus harenae TaxID=2692566 RepID=UPI0013315B8C|nr:toprim domain-containing protein [Roseomonas harenae]